MLNEGPELVSGIAIQQHLIQSVTMGADFNLTIRQCLVCNIIRLIVQHALFSSATEHLVASNAVYCNVAFLGLPWQQLPKLMASFGLSQVFLEHNTLHIFLGHLTKWRWCIFSFFSLLALTYCKFNILFIIAHHSVVVWLTRQSSPHISVRRCLRESSSVRPTLEPFPR